ncbi:unnamed protein product, partial [Linum grandiflorum]
IAFNYDNKLHNVVRTDQEGHDTCTVTLQSIVYESGHDAITLSYGSNYFISSLNSDCPAGMKMAIVVHSPPPL